MDFFTLSVTTVDTATDLLEPGKLEQFLLDKGPSLLTALIVLVVGMLLIKLFMHLLTKALGRSKLDVTLHAFIKSLLRITLYVLLFIICAGILGIPSESLITAVGAVGLAVSLAVKDGLTNLAGGVTVLATKPFGVGDYIEGDGVGGTVQRIDLYHTVLSTVDNKSVFIPNGQIINAKITNFSAEPVRRLDMKFNIGYQDSFEEARDLILSIVNAHPLALFEPAPVVRMSAHGASSIELVCKVWVKSEHYWDLLYDLNEQVKAAFDAHSINIPYNQLDVHLHQAQ